MVIDDDADDDKPKGGMSAAEVTALVKSIMDQGRGAAELEKYLEQNLKLRRQKAALNEEVVELKKKVPAEGAVVLTGDDAKEHAEVVALGKKAKEIKKVLDSHEALVEKTTKLERTQLLTQIADAEGWKQPLLERLTQGMELVLEDVNEDVDDEESGGTKKAQVKRGFVQKTEGGTTTKVRLSEELKELLGSLAKEGASGVEESGGQITDFPKQVRGETSGKGGKGGSDLKGLAGKHIGSRYKAPGSEAAAK